MSADLLGQVHRLSGRLRHGIQRFGLAGAVKCGFKQLFTWPSRRRALAQERRFDRAFGVETAGIVRLDALQIASTNKRAGNRYQATSPELFRRLMDRIRIDHRQFVFIDVGSGKGRILLLASQLPFKRVVGIEFSRQLHEVALRNIAAYPKQLIRCGEIESVCADAVELDVPPGPTVFFFYNPFEAGVLDRVLTRIKSSWVRFPRLIYIIYIGDVTVATRIEGFGLRRLSDTASSAPRSAVTAGSDVAEVFVWPDPTVQPARSVLGVEGRQHLTGSSSTT
jgi:hypothetical protein